MRIDQGHQSTIHWRILPHKWTVPLLATLALMCAMIQGAHAQQVDWSVNLPASRIEGHSPDAANLYTAGLEAFTQGQLEDAIDLLMHSAEGGSPAAMVMLGTIMKTRQGKASGAPTSLELFQQAADQGDSSAQYALSVAYIYGDGVEVDIEHSIALASEAIGGDFVTEYPGLLYIHASIHLQRGQTTTNARRRMTHYESAETLLELLVDDETYGDPAVLALADLYTYRDSPLFDERKILRLHVLVLMQDRMVGPYVYAIWHVRNQGRGGSYSQARDLAAEAAKGGYKDAYGLYAELLMYGRGGPVQRGVACQWVARAVKEDASISGELVNFCDQAGLLE